MSGKCVTVIMPIYNSEKELNRSIKSVLEQTYTNLQLILVDDGSTDKSYDICMDYKARDARVDVFKLKNGGVSVSRNYALDYVKGDYLTFLDSDDEMKKNAIETMIKNLEMHGADLVVCSYYKDFGEHIKIPVEKLEKARSYTSKEYLCNTLRDPGHHYYGVVWNKLYKTDIISENNIRFDTSVNLGEDFIFNLDYLLYAENISVILKRLLYYNKAKSRTLSQNKTKTIDDCRWELFNRKRIFSRYIESFKTEGLYVKYKKQIHFYWIIFYVRQMHDVYKEYISWSEEEKEIWIEEVNSTDEIKDSLKIVDSRLVNKYKRKYQHGYAVKRTIKNFLGMK